MESKQVFKVTTNPLIESTQTAKAADPTNLKAHFINETSNKEYSNQNMPLGMVAVPFTPVNFVMSRLKDQGQPLSSHTVELKIKGLAELSETSETEHFAEATTSYILRYWKDNTIVRTYNVKTNFIATDSNE